MCNTCAWGIHISMKVPKSVRQHWVYMIILDKGESEGNIDFRGDHV